jgi:hypothetical protein
MLRPRDSVAVSASAAHQVQRAGLLQQRAHRLLQLLELTAAELHQLALRIDTHFIDAAQIVANLFQVAAVRGGLLRQRLLRIGADQRCRGGGQRLAQRARSAEVDGEQLSEASSVIWAQAWKCSALVCAVSASFWKAG